MGAALSLVLFVEPARAQGRAPVADAREQERAALYKAGLALAQAGRWDQALAKFQEVVAIRSAAPALVALATAQEKLGKFASAKRSWVSARADAQAAGDEGLVRRAEAGLQEVEGRLARISIRLPGDAPGAQATIDGTPVQTPAQSIEVDPGEHLVTVAATGKQPFSQRLRVTEGQASELIAELKSTSPSDPAPTATATAPSRDDRAESPAKVPPTGALLLGGVAAAVTVIGVIVRVDGASAYDSAREGCNDAHCPSEDLAHRGNAARDRMLAGTLLAGAGLAGIAGAGLWWAFDRAPSTTRSPGALSIRAGASASAWSVRLAGKF
jgi:hypothetical protein